VSAPPVPVRPTPVEAAALLADLARGLAAAGTLEDAVELGLDAVRRLLPGDGAAVAERLDEPAGSLVVLGAVGPEARVQPAGAALGASSLAAAVLRGGPRVSLNLDAEPEAAANPLRARLARAGVMVPMRLGGGTGGVLTVSAADVPWRVPDPADLQLLAAAADQLGGAIVALRTRGQLLKRLDQIDALGRIAHALTGVEDAHRTMEFVAEEGREVFLAQRAGVFLFDWASGRAHCVVALGLPTAFVDATCQGLLQTPLARTLARRLPVFHTDALREAEPALRDAVRDAGFRSAALLPLVFGGETIGMLGFYHDRPQPWPHDEQRLATAFADQAALAIGKSRLVDQIARGKREWQSAFDATAGGLAITDAGGRVLRGNLALARMAGLPVTELPGRELRAILPAWPEAGPDPMRDALAGGRAVTGLLEVGDRLHVVTATPLPDRGLVVALEDVTEVVRLEDRFRRVVQNAYDAIVIADPDGRVAFANPAAAELFDAPVEELLRRPLDELVPDPAGAPPGLPAATAARRFESVVRQADGGVRHVAVSSAPLGEAGHAAGRVAVLRDVTAERVAAEERRRSEARYRTLFASAPLAIFTLSAEGRFLSVNGAALSLVGLAQPRAALRLQEFLTPDEAQRLEADLARTLAGEAREFTLRFRRLDGAVREAALVMVAVDEPATGRAVLTIARDITDERAMRDRLIHTEKMAALGQLVSGVAHELNNPLAGIAALAQALMLEEPLDPGTRRVLEAIREEAGRAGRTVTDLLTFGRQRPLDRAPTDLNALVRDILLIRPPGGAAFRLDLAPGLPQVDGDAGQLRQVILNLLGNAEYAMRGGAGSGRVITWATDTAVGLAVEDEGTGIPPEAMAHVFEPFFTTKGGDGSGLGLSISHGIVRAHGGEIRALNRPEGGARVWFELPRAGAQ
jgi:PAS domain S-box-containing protein